MNNFGPSEDCFVCGQATNPDEFRKCHGCDTKMCAHCCAHHFCMEVLNKKRELFLEEFKPVFTELLMALGYYIDGILDDDTIVWELYSTNSEYPRMELHIKQIMVA